jgi:hypothetical protein
MTLSNRFDSAPRRLQPRWDVITAFVVGAVSASLLTALQLHIAPLLQEVSS